MRAGVYRGQGQVRHERVRVPEIGAGEILVQVEACGICHTDLKKIEHDLLPPPRIFGHETAGVVAATAPDVTQFAPGDRVCVFHHIPCMGCFYCRHGDYAQCAGYKRVGVTAGFEPAGGGFAQYVRVMDWIVERGVEVIPSHVSFERATFVEPLSTCLKAIEKCEIQDDESVVVLGQGPIGLLFTMLLHRRGLERVYTTDVLGFRLEMSRRLGAREAWNPAQEDIDAAIRRRTEGRGADVVLVAAATRGIVEQAVEMSRRGARILLFAQTAPEQTFQLSGASLCAGDRTLLGSYSVSVDLQKEAAATIWSDDFPVEQLISHRLELDKLNDGIERARRPAEGSLKVMMHPQR